MSSLFSARRLAALALLAGVLMAWALAERSSVAVPLSAVFVLAAFAWSLVRAHEVAFGPRTRATPVDGVCAGCRAGCVGCRERIDSPT